MNSVKNRGLLIYPSAEAEQLNLIPHYSFMEGFPTETKEDFHETISLMNRLKEENPSAVLWKINQYTPYPGTELFDLAVQRGFKPPERFEEWSHVFFTPKSMQPRTTCNYEQPRKAG